MKKLISVFVICVIVVGVVFAFTKVPVLKEKVDILISKFTKEQIDEYTEDFEINRLKIKNQSFYYNTLNDTQKYIYTALANSIRDINNVVKLSDYTYVSNDETAKDVDIVMQAFFADHPEVFYVESKYTISTTTVFFKDVVEINVEYNVESKEDLEEKITTIENKINEYLALVNTDNIFDIELVLHDNLLKNVSYYNYDKIENVPQYCHDIYGAFVKKEAVCDGFTKSMQILLDRKNIESIVVLGDLENEAHAWNLVKLDDSWYHLDVTSDQSIKEKKNGTQIVTHAYYNLTTDEILKSHKLDTPDIIPNANETKYNYYIYTGKVVSTNDNFANKLSVLLTNNTNENIMEFYAPNISSVPDKIVDTLSRNRYTEYIINNKINYYTMEYVYVIMKN